MYANRVTMKLLLHVRISTEPKIRAKSRNTSVVDWPPILKNTGAYHAAARAMGIRSKMTHSVPNNAVLNVSFARFTSARWRSMVRKREIDVFNESMIRVM
ncbi:hypothetical protein MmazTMA_32490 [Methanosarcina mazei]|nr:hypothetical protein MmazTMA_32490 [Methanosarcina mazei]